MRSIEQLTDEDPGEPPSPEPAENYFDLLFDAHDRLRMYPPYPSVSSKTGEFEVRLFDDYENLEIEASLHGDLADRYRSLDSDRQDELAWYIEQGIGRTALSLFGDDYEELCEKETVVLINNLPVIFEPTDNAMLVGRWDDWEKRKMQITSDGIADRNQQRLLLGGLAAFVTYLEQR